MAYDLYDGTPPHVDTDTSRAAAHSIEPVVTELARKVLAHVTARGEDGATCWEVETEMGMSHQTASARIRELCLHGKLKDSERRRKTGSNRRAIVWIPGDGRGGTFDDQVEAAVGRVEGWLINGGTLSKDDVRIILGVTKRSLKWQRGARRPNKKQKRPKSRKMPW